MPNRSPHMLPTIRPCPPQAASGWITAPRAGDCRGATNGLITTIAIACWAHRDTYPPMQVTSWRGTQAQRPPLHAGHDDDDGPDNLDDDDEDEDDELEFLLAVPQVGPVSHDDGDAHACMPVWRPHCGLHNWWQARPDEGSSGSNYAPVYFHTLPLPLMNMSLALCPHRQPCAESYPTPCMHADSARRSRPHAAP